MPRAFQTRSIARGLLLAALLGIAGVGAGCARSASLQWAQTTPAIEPLPTSSTTVSLGLRASEPDESAGPERGE